MNQSCVPPVVTGTHVGDEGERRGHGGATNTRPHGGTETFPCVQYKTVSMATSLC